MEILQMFDDASVHSKIKTEPRIVDWDNFFVYIQHISFDYIMSFN